MNNVAAGLARAREQAMPRGLPGWLSFRIGDRATDAAILLTLIFAFFWKIAFTRQYGFYASPDIAYQALPWYQFLADALRHGTIGLWDPYAYFGQPLLGPMQPGVLSPFTFALIAAPLSHGHINLMIFSIWLVIIHYCGAVFAMLLLRDLGIPRAAAIIGGVFYATGGYVGTTDWPYMLAGAIWGPLVLMFLLRSMRGVRPLTSAGWAGCFLGLSWLSGHHQAALYLSITAISIFGWLMVTRRQGRREILMRAAAFAAVTGLIAAVQLLPSAEYGPLALRWTRSGAMAWNQMVPFTEHEFFGVKPEDLLSLLVPGGWTLTMGVVAAALASVALISGFHRVEVRLSATMAAVALLLSMARNDVFYGLLYLFVPMIEKSREPIRMLSIFHLAMTILVGSGAGVFLEKIRPALLPRAARWLAIFGGATFALWYAASFLKTGATNAEADPRVLMAGLIALLAAGVFAAYGSGGIGKRSAAVCVLLLMMIELGNTAGYGWVHRSQNDLWSIVKKLDDGDEIAAYLRRQPEPLRTTADRDDLDVNFGDWYGIETVEAYLASMLKETADVPWWEPRLRSMLGIGYVVTRKSPPELHDIAFTAHNGLKVYRNPDAFPRAWSVHRLVRAATDAAAIELLRDNRFDLRNEAVMTSPPPALETCAGSDQVEAVRESIQSAEFDVTMACRGLVALSDSWYPGWRVTIDGAKKNLLRINAQIRGVVVERGHHHVRFAYRPASVYAGFSGMLFGIAMLVFLARRPEIDGEDILRTT